ncbi:hypothetical protein [Roseibium sp. LAB1]
MKPNLRPTRISKHAAEFAEAASKSIAKQAAQKGSGATSMATKVASAASNAFEKAGGAASMAGGVAKKAGSPGSPLAPAWNDDIAKTIGKADTTNKKSSADAAQAESWMAVELMSSLASGGGAGGSGGGSSQPAFTAADETAVIEAIKPAIKNAIDLWKSAAHFTGLTIMSVSAIGTPGCLDGMSLEPHIRSHAKIQALSGPAREMANGIAEAFSDSFYLWQNAVTVPGLPWYPAFAAYPGPAAPPMPNVPAPLITCVSSKSSKLVLPSELASTIKQALPASLSSKTDFINRVAGGLALSATTWLASAQVMLVLGFGPVPSFAPPYVPVGPVINGTNIAVPGHLASAPQFNPMIF